MISEEQLIATLQACYFGDRGVFNKILKEYKNLQQKNQQLKDNWNELKERITKHLEGELVPLQKNVMGWFLKQMQELEKESDVK